jgi:signal transduction histidine kinase
VEGLVHRFHRLQAVTDAALSFSGPAAPDELLDSIRALLDADTCAILLLDEERHELVAYAAAGIEEELEQRIHIPVGKGFAGRVAAELRPVVLPDVEHADVLNPLLRKKGIASLAGVPLVVDGRPIGVLHVGTLERRVFTREEVDLLQLAGDRVAIAISHARAFESERAVRRRLEHVQAIVDAGFAHLEVDALLAELLERLRAILGVDTCAVLLVDPERRELVARAAVGIEEEVEQGVRIPLGKGFAGRIAAEGRAIGLPDVDHADVFNPLLREKGIKSLLGVPLAVHGHITGVLHVGTLTPRAFTRDDTEFLQLVAERVAVAIEKARVHDEMIALDELKLSFVAVASHELRTPATAVYGILTTLRERSGSLDEEARRQLEETAWEQADRMRRLIEQLLDLSRLDARSVTIDPQPLVLWRVLEEVVEATAPGAVSLSVDPGVAVVADPLVLDRVISNLVANASRYGKPPIRIEAAERDQFIRIVVSDAGDGVPEELVPRLFDRFERGTSGQGSGLGLAIARAYANAHGGELLYHPDKGGACFELILPRAP